MKVRQLTPLLALLATTTVLGGPEHLIKQRAKDVRDQQNERQGAAPATPAPAMPRQPSPAVPPAARQPAGPALSPHATAIAECIETIQKAETAIDDQVGQLGQRLGATAQGRVKPSQSKIDKLARDIATATAGTELSAAKRARLAQQLERALNDPMNAGEMTAMTGEVEQQLRDAGVGRVPAAIVSNDLKSIIAEVQQGRTQ